MAQGYCLKCKAHKEIKDAETTTLQNLSDLRQQDLQDRRCQVKHPAFGDPRAVHTYRPLYFLGRSTGCFEEPLESPAGWPRIDPDR